MGQDQSLPGFGTQCFDFILLNELTASELLYLSVQVTDVPHCDTHREELLTQYGHTHTLLSHLGFSEMALLLADRCTALG